MKFVRMLILALGLVTLVTAPSFAAVAFLTTSTTNIIATNAQTGLTGSVLYTPLVAGVVQVAPPAGEVINLSYSVPISFLSDIVIVVKASTTATPPVAINECFGCTTAQVGAGQAYAGLTSVSGAAFSSYGTTQTSTASGVSVTVTQTGVLIGFASSLSFNPAAAGSSDIVRIDGVRVDVSASATPGGTLNVQLTNAIGQAQELNNQLQVATYSDPLQNGFLAIPAVVGVNNTTNALYFYTTLSGATGTNSAGSVPYPFAPAGTIVPQNTVTVTLGEIFPNALESKAASTTKLSINVTNIPAGLTMSNVAVVGLTSVSGSPIPTFTNQCPNFFTCFTNAANPINLAINNTQRSNALEGLQTAITFSATSGTTNLALNPPAITYAVSLTPAGPTIPAGNPGAGGPDYPFNNPTIPQPAFPGYTTGPGMKYATKTLVTGSIPVTIVPLQTNLMAAFAMAVKDDGHPSGYSYNTGFAIANTSGTGPNPTAAATGLAGTITATFYPFDGSGPKSFTTASDKKPGSGLSSTGTLAPKATWIFLLNDALAAAGITTSFQGFVRFQCNFMGGAGISYIADGEFDVSAQGYPLLSDVPIAASPLPVGGYF
jgi:hypothetical protein